MSRPKEQSEGETGVKERPETARPKLYRVLLHNDDYTTMDFVVYILMEYFAKERGEATQIMLHVHTKGTGLCGIYPYEVAETKVKQVLADAKKNEMPLLCTLELDQST
jgi:ATP-dependent Clp protease adaptor protein ClpS